MGIKRIYLDYNASAPMREAVIEKTAMLLRYSGNPSSPHHEGRALRAEIEKARFDLARLTGGKQVVFTSGGTEANNLVLSGIEADEIFTSAIEHPSVLKAVPQAKNIAVLPCGRVDLDYLEERFMKSSIKHKLVSVMLANNETGIIQPVRKIADLCQKFGAWLHCDATQAFGRIPIDMVALGIDVLSLSSHKLGGPHGVGAVILSRDIPISAMIKGGGQERYIRSGTENTAAVSGFALAARLAVAEITGWVEKQKWRKDFEQNIKKTTPEAIIYGEKLADHQRLANTICVAFPRIEAQIQVMHFDLEGVAIGAGSACSSGRIAPSHVLLAMGVPSEIAKTAIRISWGYDTPRCELDYFIEKWKRFIGKKINYHAA